MTASLHGLEPAAALALLARSPRVLFVFEADPTPLGLCPVLVNGTLVFPWPQGRRPPLGTTAIAFASEHVASIPPALGGGALGLEVQAQGPLIAVDDPSWIDAATRLGARAEARRAGDEPLWLRFDRMELKGTAQLAQERPPAERLALLDALWARGLPEDPRAIDWVRRASPDLPAPAFLRAPDGATLWCALEPTDEGEAVALLGQTWRVDLSPQAWGEAHRHSSAWVGARDASGRLCATARAVGDWSRDAWIYDVMVAPDRRGRGLGQALLRLLLEHPALRHVKRVRLRSSERALSLYTRFGFQPVNGQASSGTVELCRIRPG